MENKKLSASERARLGGLAVSQNKEHMAEMGRKGGAKVSQNREWMSYLGKRGVEARRKKRFQRVSIPT